MSKKVIIKVDQFGGIHYDAENFQGSECADATAVFASVFHGGASDETKKPEYYAGGISASEKASVGQKF